MDYVVSSRASLRRLGGEPVEGSSPLWSRLDWVLLAAVGAIVGYGLWAIAGITRHEVDGNPDYYVIRQAVYAAVGAAGLVAAAHVDLDFLRRHQRAIYGLLLALIVLVMLPIGVEARGSQRWLELGFLRFQPSEFGKLLFALSLAAFLADRAKRLHESRTVLLAVGLALVPVLLVFLQPDIGTALVYGAGLFALLFAAGARWRHLAALALATVLSAVAVV